MHRLGSPAHNYKFFEEIFKNFSDLLHIGMTKYQEIPIGAMVLLKNGVTCANPWTCSDSDFFHLRPNDFNYWKSIEWAKNQGFEYFDMGRSTNNSTHADFKKKFGTIQQPIISSYWLIKAKSIPDLTSNKKIALLTKTWSKLPRPLISILNPFFAKMVN